MIIISAGMYRSGSTLLFNMLREMLAARWGTRLISGWEGDVDLAADADVLLIKTHTLSTWYMVHAQHLFFSYRDIRTVMVSALHMFGQRLDIESIRANVLQYQRAKHCCDLMVKYEDMTERPLKVIGKLAQILDIEVDTKSIYERISGLKPPEEAGYSKFTLLHKDHTQGTNDREWSEVAPHDLQQMVLDEFGWWFRECGYEL